MAPHLTPAELDVITMSEAKGMTPIAIHEALVRKRTRCGLAAPTLRRFRDTLRGLTFQRARKETRGHPLKLTRQNVLTMNAQNAGLRSRKQTSSVRFAGRMCGRPRGSRKRTTPH